MPERDPISEPRFGLRKHRLALIVAAMIALTASLVAVTVGRQQLMTIAEQSFTRLPAEYDEMFFKELPTVRTEASGTAIDTIIGISHHGADTQSYQLDVQLLATPASGSQNKTERFTLAPGQSTDIRLVMPLQNDRPAAAVVAVLAGTGNSLRYTLPTAQPSDPAQFFREKTD
jgi:hypothetical protein